ncbi:MAG TPA: efflux RND transporter periplasmic adaptor subunit [Steroidobacteraceae bacterium]
MRLLHSLAAVAIGIFVAAPWTYADDTRDAGKDEVSVLVRTAAVKRGSLPRIVVAYGVAKANPTAQESVVAKVSAVVAAVHVRTGQAVRKDAPLVELRPTPSTRATYAAALSAQRAAADALTRTKQLVADLLATGQQLAAAEKADSDARSALQALQAQGAGGPAVLRAPFPAVVTAVSAAPNSIVAEGAPLVELARPNGLILSTGVVPAQAASIEPGNAVIVEALGRSATLKSRVALRGAAVDPASGLVPVDVSLPSGALLPGETARASITIGEAQGFIVPHAAILVNEQGDAYVVQAVRGVAKSVPVRILATAGDEDAVDGRLDAAAPLVVAGNHQLQDGMKVRYANEAAGARP